ncbi:hypothetical protein [Mycobacterium sp. Lab-001]
MKLRVQIKGRDETVEFPDDVSRPSNAGHKVMSRKVMMAAMA